MAASRESISSTSFRYNARLAVALLPCMALLLGIGGQPVAATLTIGLMISYILDSLLLKRGAFFGLWGTLGATSIAYFISTNSHSSSLPWAVELLSLLVALELVFLVGVWASLQFRWLQLENPSVVVALERVLFTCTPIVAGACQTWGVIAAVGLEHAAFFLLGIQFALYWLFILPRPSSYKSKAEKSYGGQISDDSVIVGALEACLHTLMLLFFPLLLHLGVHHRRLGSINMVCELVLLFFVPLLFQLYASTKGALWWLVKNEGQLQHFRLVNGAISLFSIIICLEVRVVFHAFNQFIQIPPPLNYLLVTSALLGAACAAALFLLGQAGSLNLAILLLVAAVSSALLVGMPLKFLPAPIAAAFFLANFMTKKSLISYLIFFLSASASVIWFTFHNYWSLNIWVGGAPLQTVCKLLLGSIMVALAVPGLVALPGKGRYVVDVALVGHAMLVCKLENQLYNFPGMYFYISDEDAIYPSYMVLLTTIVGLLLTRKLETQNRITSYGSWILSSLYGCKLSMIFLASRRVLWASAFLALAITPPVLLYKQKGKTGGQGRMKAWQAIGHAAVILVVLCWFQGTVVEALEWYTGRRPAESVVLGSIILLTALGSAPIVTQHFNHVQSARRSLVLVLATGLLCILLQPPLPKLFSGSSDSYIYFGDSTVSDDDEALYGGIAAVPTWSTWLLLGTVISSLAALSSALPVRHFVTLRFTYAVGVGTSMGLYMATRHFPEPFLVGLLVVLALNCASVFLVFALLPSASSPKWIVWVFNLLVALLPVMYVLEELGGWATGEEDKLVSLLALKGARSSLLGLYAAIFMLIALVVKLQLASIMKEKAASSSSSSFVPKHRLLQQQRASHLAPLAVKKLAAEGARMPMIGNVSTISCFVICVALNLGLTGGSDRAILFLAPILLLLNQDTNLLTGFGDRQRYLPLSAAVSIYLAISAMYKLWEEVWHGRHNSTWGLETGGAGLFYAVKNGLLFLATLPSHALFNLFMWNQVRQSSYVLLLTAPLNVPVIVATDISTVRALGLLAIMLALLQFIITRRIRIAGMKYI